MPESKNVLNFPKGFLWGASTSAYQIEGNNTNTDWWEWQNKGNGGDLSGIACDSYNRYEEDFYIAEKLNFNAFRLSIEWARIEPIEGSFDVAATEHYKKVLGSLKNKGIKTFVTLHHFSSPIWFSKKGGWKNSKSPQIFSKYAKYCAQNFKDLVDFWITINEPSIYVAPSYLWGKWPPQEKNILSAGMVFINLSRGHKEAYKEIKSVCQSPVGFSNNIPRFDAVGVNPVDKLACKVANILCTDIFFNLINKKMDFIGLNYYNHFKMKNFKIFFDYTYGKTDFENWSVDPEGIYLILKNLKKYNLPIYITENGCDDKDDKIRKFYITKHLENIHKAIQEGVDVKGYLHWSLMDNYEWGYGFRPKFGLVEIDRENNLKRILRPSANFYGDVCKNNAVDVI